MRFSIDHFKIWLVKEHDFFISGKQVFWKDRERILSRTTSFKPNSDGQEVQVTETFVDNHIHKVHVNLPGFISELDLSNYQYFRAVWNEFNLKPEIQEPSSEDLLTLMK